MHFFQVSKFLFLTIEPTRVYKLNYWMYVFTGFWRYESTTRWKTNFYKLYNFTTTFFGFFSVTSYFWEAIQLRNNLNKLSLNMSNNVLVIITVMKVLLLRKNSDRVESLLKNLENNLNIQTVGQSMEDKAILRERAKALVRLNRILYGFLIVSFVLRVVADTSLEPKGYLIPVPGIRPMWDDYYGFIYAQQAVLCMHFLTSVIAHDLFIYGTVNRFISHFEILEKNFSRISLLYPRTNFEAHVRGYEESCRGEKAVSEDSVESALKDGVYLRELRVNLNKNERREATEKMAKKMLKRNIYHHQELLKEVVSFTQVYSAPFVIQAFAAVIITGIVAIKIIFLSGEVTALLLQQVMYVVINLINNLFLCTLGSELSNKSVAAANALYGIPWYAMGSENRGIICFALKKLLAAPKLKGGGWVVINRITYLKFLQTSYNMVVLLRNLYKA